jgi:transcriptional regulator with XRE-family HTH domain
MRFSAEKLSALRKAQGLPLKDVLEKAGVSKTAYYHLVGRDSILPRSVTAIAAALGVRASELLEEDAPAPEKVRRIALLAERLAARNPGLDAENARHTLLLLEEPPIERLRRALIRGRKPDLHS